MRNLILSLTLISVLAGCGYQGVDMQAIGQVKTIMHDTPLICGNFTDFDLSLGVMRNGTGSMSTEDIWIVVQNDEDLELVKKAQESGALIKVTFDAQRFPICTDGRFAKKIELVK